MKIEHLEPSPLQKTRAFSPAVITEGGRIVWLAGQTATVDLEGKDISGKFDEQARTVFGLIGRTLERAAPSVTNSVPLTWESLLDGVEVSIAEKNANQSLERSLT